MLREDLKKNSTEITEDRAETATGSGDSGQGSLSEKEVYDVLSENSRKVINVSASYAFLSSLTKDYPLLPAELAASQESVQRYVAALAADPVSALAAAAGTDDFTYITLIKDLIGTDSELVELLSNTLTSRFHVVKSYAATDEFFSLCTTLPRVFRENNAPGMALMHYLCELVANILTADNITPALVKRLEKLHISVPHDSLTVKGKVIFSRLFIAVIEFIMAHQPNVLYLISHNRAALYQAAREQELRNFIRDAVDEIPEDTGKLGLFASEEKYQDEESEAIARRVDNLIRRAASIAQSANLINGEGNGEIVDADLPGKDDTFDADRLTEDEIRKFFRENSHTGMSGLYDEELLSRYDFSRSMADDVSRKVLFPGSGEASQAGDGTDAQRPQMNIDLIGEFNSFRAQCEKLSGNEKDRSQDTPQNASLSRRVNELIQKVANDVEYINSENTASQATAGSEPGDSLENPERHLTDNPVSDGESGLDLTGTGITTDEMRIFSDENSLSEAIARENTENENSEDKESAACDEPVQKSEEAGNDSAGETETSEESVVKENTDGITSPVSAVFQDENDEADEYLDELNREQQVLIRMAESVRQDNITVYPDPETGAGEQEKPAEEPESGFSTPEETDASDASDSHVSEAGNDRDEATVTAEEQSHDWADFIRNDNSGNEMSSGEEFKVAETVAEDRYGAAETDGLMTAAGQERIEPERNDGRRNDVSGSWGTGGTGGYSWVKNNREPVEAEKVTDRIEIVDAGADDFMPEYEHVTSNQIEEAVHEETVSADVTTDYVSDNKDSETSDSVSFSDAGATASSSFEQNDGYTLSESDEYSEHDAKESEKPAGKSFFARIRNLFASGRKVKNRSHRKETPDFNEINHRSVPMARLVSSLNAVLDNKMVSPEIHNMTRAMSQTITEPLRDVNDVMEWLGFVGNPLTTEGRRGRIIQQWAAMILSIRFRMLGRDVSQFKSTEPYADLDFSGDCDWIEENLFLTLQQIERMQLLSGFSNELGLPAFIPLPPLYRSGREGGMNVSHFSGESGVTWKINFFFELEKLGAVQILIELYDRDVRVNLVSEKFETLQLINSTSQQLKDGIEKHGLNVSSVNSRMGTVYPPSV